MGFLDKIVGAVAGSLSNSGSSDKGGDGTSCDNCGRAVDLDAEKAKYDEHYQGETTYDDIYYSGEQLCARCAIEHSDEAYGAGLRLDYSLSTGHPPEDMPDDWTMSKD